MLKTFGKREIRGKKEKDLTKWDRYVILIKIDSEKKVVFFADLKWQKDCNRAYEWIDLSRGKVQNQKRK